MHHINARVCRRKLVSVLRDKFNEADRPFIPSFFNSVTAYEEYFKQTTVETRPATLVIKENRPIYSVYPVFSVKGAPLTTLLLRIRPVFEFLTTQNDILPSIMNTRDQTSSESTAPIVDRSMIDEVLKRSGQLILNSLTLIKTEQTTVDTLMPKFAHADRQCLTTSEIEFKPFDVITEMCHTVKLSKLAEAFKHFDEFPEYLLVEVDTKLNDKPGLYQTGSSNVLGTYNLMSMVDADGMLYECMIDATSSTTCWLRVDGLSYSMVSDLNAVKPVMLLLRNSTLLSTVSAQPITVSGKYTKPEVAEKAVMLFRTPISCKQTSIEEIDSHPISMPCAAKVRWQSSYRLLTARR